MSPHTLLEVREENDFVAAARVKENLHQLGESNQIMHMKGWPDEQENKTKNHKDFNAYVDIQEKKNP